MEMGESPRPAAWIVASIEEGYMSLFDLVFGCWHKRCSFPITVRGKLRRSTAAASVTGTYVVCLDCGREFPYDWSQMKMLASKHRTAWAAESVTIVPGSQGGLRLGAGPFAKTHLCLRSGEQSAVPGRLLEVPLLN